MSSYLDALVFGIRDVFDKLGAKLPTRTGLQFRGAVTVEDDPENRRTIVTVTGGGGGGPIPVGGDLDGDSDDARVVGIQGVPIDDAAPADGDVLTFDAGDGKAKWQAPTGGPASPYLASVEIDLPTATSPEDFHVYTVPACIDATITFVLLSVEEQLVGAGDITVRIGTTAGDDDLIIDQVINSSTPIGHVAGKDISTLGAAWPASSGYVLDVKENDEIHVRVTTNGTIDSGKIRVSVVGVVIP